MDFDFIVTCIVYLAMILFIHMSLKENESPVIKESIIKKDNSIQEKQIEPEIISNVDNTPKEVIDDVDAELIINANELKNIGNDTPNNDFIKYLEVEGADTDSTYQKLTSPLQENTIDVTENDTKTDLDKYFTNIKEEQYNFDPVPTKPKEKSKDIYSDVKSLNINDDVKDIMAFDEFDAVYASL
jgi:hypothetical protein|tara:strand:+ start:178 stop:732 length:555 start_codon:yes stop_codon:yes gene_type:complete